MKKKQTLKSTSVLLCPFIKNLPTSVYIYIDIFLNTISNSRFDADENTEILL